jgi:hypothetical protein
MGRQACFREDVVKIPKPTEDDRAYFRSLIPDDPRVNVKPMFGNIGGFVNGNMFCGLFGSDVGVRLTDPRGPGLVEAGGGPFGPAERPMGGYLTLPAPRPIDDGHGEREVSGRSSADGRHMCDLAAESVQVRALTGSRESKRL